MNFVPSHALKESYRRKAYYFVCLFSCFLVCIVTLVSRTMIKQSAFVFLMLGERESGQIDIILTPDGMPRDATHQNIDGYYFDWGYINYTKLSEAFMAKEESKALLKNSAIRTTINGSLAHDDSSLSIFLINSTKEREMEIGRTFPQYDLGIGECIVHRNVKRRIEGDNFVIKLNLTNFIRNTLLMYYTTNKDSDNSNIAGIGKLNTLIDIPCKIKLVIQENHGKVGENEISTVIMESELFYKHLAKHIPQEIKSKFKDYQAKIEQIKANDYGNSLIINFPPNRIHSYIESDFDNLVKKSVILANAFVREMDALQHTSIYMPLIRQMKQYSMGSVLMNLIMTLIIFALFLLSILLIYSLLMITMETNSFEFGVLRLIGTTNKDVIKIIFFQCFIFAFPAFLLAFGCQFIVLSLVNSLIKSFVHTNLGISFDGISFVLAILVTSLAPITASILPIRSILKKNISASLNTMINKTSAIKVEVISLAKNEMVSMVIFGLATFLYGLSIHYFLPLSLVSLDLSMLGLIFVMILVGILVGSVILAMNVENILQKVFTYALFFFTKSYTKDIIIKNLTAHRLKNRKTSIMYSLSVGLFIMCSVALDIIIQSVQMANLMKRGTEVLLSSSDHMRPADLRDSLVQMFDLGLIESFAFKSHDLSDLADSKLSLVNLGGMLKYEVGIIGVSPTFFNTTKAEFLKIAENSWYKDKAYNTMLPTEQLYLKESIGKIGLSGIFTHEFNLHLDDSVYIKIAHNNIGHFISLINKPAFIINSAAGAQMNKEPSVRRNRDTIISIPHLIDLMNKCSLFFTKRPSEIEPYHYSSFPINTLSIVPSRGNTTKEALSTIADILDKSDKFNGKVWLFEHLKGSINNVSEMVTIIFNSISAVVLFFCFFNIAASMTININQQGKEIAILRSIGMKASHIIFVFISEAIVLILTSSFIGTIIGSLIAYTISLQWQVFNNMYLNFSINYISLIIVIVLSIIGGIVTTIIPAVRMMKRPICSLIKIG